MVLGFSFRALGVCVSSLLAREGCRKSKHIVVQLGHPSLVRVFAFMLQAKAQHPPPPSCLHSCCTHIVRMSIRVFAHERRGERESARAR